jgi:hypothetical protein
MSPLPGIYASAISGNVNAPAFQGDYWALNTITLSSNATSVTFTGIPQNYTHLQIRAITRDTQTNTNINSLYMFLNGDTGANYAWHRLEGFGSGTPTAGGASSTGSGIWIGPNSTNGYASNIFASHIIDILDYTSTAKYKTTRHLGGFDTNGTGTEPGEVNLTSGLWMSTAPVTSLTFSISTYSQVANSSFALYGVK